MSHRFLVAACQQFGDPPTLDDGWRPAAPDELGLSCEPLQEMTAAIERGDHRNVHAVLIVGQMTGLPTYPCGDSL